MGPNDVLGRLITCKSIVASWVSDHISFYQQGTLEEDDFPKLPKGGDVLVSWRECTRWWFQILFIFAPTWGNDPF